MKPGSLKIVVAVALLAAASGWFFFNRQQEREAVGKETRSGRPVPVEVAPVQHGPISLERTFSGELEALAEFVVAPKVNGRVERVMVNIADQVERDQVVAELDNAEYVQAVAQARADLAVADANLSEAQSALETAEREFKRTESLFKRGIASDSEHDAASQVRLAKQAQLKVASAQLAKAEASLETAKIRLGYTRVIAGWTGGDDHRVVAERYVDEGQTVAANAPLLLIVELNPIGGIFFVTERDYANLEPGQPVSLATDAYPGERFFGRIDRIAPVFRKSTRQARVELSIDNPQQRLKPGMFIRASVELQKIDEATIVPRQALTQRNDVSGVFIVGQDGKTVHWRPVTVGVQQGDMAQVAGPGLSGQVVTLGQQLVNDGSAITIPNGGEKNAPDRPAGRHQ